MRAAAWMMVAGLAIACGGDKDSGACETTGVVTVYLNDSGTGNPIMGSISWVDSESGSGSMACAGQCEFEAPGGAVSVTATPDDTATYGDAQTESTVVDTSSDCANPPFNGLEFEF